MSFEQILQDHASAMRELAGAITLFTGMYDRVVEQHLPARPVRPALQAPAAEAATAEPTGSESRVKPAPATAEPSAPEPKPRPEPAAPPKPTADAETATPAPTLEALRERFEAISKAGHRERLKQLIREIGGVPTLAKCDPAHYGALLVAAEALGHG